MRQTDGDSEGFVAGSLASELDNDLKRDGNSYNHNGKSLQKSSEKLKVKRAPVKSQSRAESVESNIPVRAFSRAMEESQTGAAEELRKGTQDLDSFRTICLLDSIGKELEHVIHKCVKKGLREKRISIAETVRISKGQQRESRPLETEGTVRAPHLRHEERFQHGLLEKDSESAEKEEH